MKNEKEVTSPLAQTTVRLYDRLVQEVIQKARDDNNPTNYLGKRLHKLPAGSRISVRSVHHADDLQRWRRSLTANQLKIFHLVNAAIRKNNVESNSILEGNKKLLGSDHGYFDLILEFRSRGPFHSHTYELNHNDIQFVMKMFSILVD